jgi:hypothetical protein
MNGLLPMVFSFIISGLVAAAYISLMVTGVLDELSRLSFLRERSAARLREQSVDAGV